MKTTKKKVVLKSKPVKKATIILDKALDKIKEIKLVSTKDEELINSELILKA
ncbi:hypothetical protein GCM10022386_05830 [Flavobacterium cheonhonense]|uniref:Uncharacterized protein n=1 Tax=Flavobacterium cheonhonense TaxID=706185 RepID=A0ABP7TFC4_9FLAO